MQHRVDGQAASVAAFAQAERDNQQRGALYRRRKRDAEAARAAGWDFIGVAWGYAKPEALQPYSNGKLFQQVEDILATVSGS